MNVIETKPIQSVSKETNTAISPTKLVISDLARSEDTQLSSIKKNIIKTTNKTAISAKYNNDKDGNSEAYIESNFNQPEYDMLSRQPTEYIEESYRIMNLDKSSRIHVAKRKTPALDKSNTHFSFDTQTISPAMKTSKIFPKNNVTNIHETSIRTIVSRSSVKKGQNIQSPLHAFKNRNSKVNPSSTPRILKTVAPASAHVVKAASETSTHLSSKGSRLQLGKSKKNRNKSSDSFHETLSVVERPTERPTDEEMHKKSFRRNKTKR